MSLPITISIANPDPNAAPTTFSQLVGILRTLITGEAPGSYLPYVIRAATPAVEDQNKLWIKTDVYGRPLGQFLYYDGNWRKVYDTPLGTVSYFNGNPTLYFDDTGLGLVGGHWDGWALCNGNNSTPNLSDRFIVSAHVDESGGHVAYSGGTWVTVQDTISYHTGGITGFTLDDDHTYRPARPAIPVGHWEATLNTPNVGAGLFGIGSDVNLLEADAGNTTPDKQLTLPPFYAMAPVIFGGYQIPP